ncbi:MAG: hypothetical protein K6A40_02090 [Solobacterium sp.]|nr:hypothetical protein [Solobacterium sp.]
MSILVLDIGTTSMRGILYEKDGTPEYLARRESHLIFLGDALIEEDPSDFREEALSIIREITDHCRAEDIEAVAMTSQRSSIIAVDEEGSPLLPCIMWQDTRNRSICAELSKYNDHLFQLTGAEVSTVFSGSKMTWIRQNEKEIYAKTHKFLNIPEYVCFCMTGEYVSDHTYASRTGLMNLRTGEWDPETLALYDVDPAKLCRLVQPGETAALITDAFAEASGLPKGTPLIHCGGDQQCAAAGQGVIEEGSVSITIGTGGFLMAACRKLPDVLPSGLIFNRSCVPGEYVMETNVLSCGAAFDWCARQLYGMDRIDYAFLEKELNKENFVSSCLVVPYFSGRGAPAWDPQARAVFAGITTATRRSELFKSIMESVFMEMASQLDYFRRTTPVNQICASGGVCASDALCQLLADVCGTPVYITEDPEATAFGALMTALAGRGEYASLEEVWEKLGRHERICFQPDEERHRQYLLKQKEMNALYESVKRGNTQ